MSTLTILALLLGAILLFLIFAYIRSQPDPSIDLTSDEEYLVRIDQIQGLLQEEQERRAAAEAERNEIAAELNRLRADLVEQVPRRQYENVLSEKQNLQSEIAQLQRRLQTAEETLAQRTAELATLSSARDNVAAEQLTDGEADLTTNVDNDTVLHQRDELQSELDETNSKLQEALALTGQFPIQAMEIKQLRRQLEAVTAERDDLKGKVTEAAVYIRDVQKRYQVVLDKMRQMLVQKERDASSESLASLRAEVERDELDSATNIVPGESKVAVSVSQLLSKTVRSDATEVHSIEDYLGAREDGNGVKKQKLGARAKPTEPAEEPSDSDASDGQTEKSATVVETTTHHPDADLQVIKGIGKTYAQRLRDAGIKSLPELVVASPDHLREVTGIKKWHKADPASWIDQARQLLASN